MRIAFFSKRKRQTLYTLYIMRAMRRLGHEVRHVRMNRLRRFLGRRLADRIVGRSLDRFRPDAVIVFSGDIQAETLARFCGRTKTALLLDDYFPVDAPVTEKIKQVDVFFHTMVGQLDEYRAAGAKRAVYVPSGVDPDYHRPVEPDPRFRSDVAFIGRAWYPDRLDLIQRLDRDPDAGFDLKVYGAGWREHGAKAARKEVGVRDFACVCASARIVLGIDKSAERELYFSNRTWFVLGCRGFLLTRYVPALERMFANHKHLVWYQDVEEAKDQIRFYLEHDELRQRIARAGFEFAHAHYPFDRMAATILTVLCEGGEPPPLTDPGPSLPRGGAEVDTVRQT